ncbi:hypothetical protein AURDEDRAFT_167884 [Auricularia subglabra TFB-10046 SS5]|nr:hypothetical protein AURDEDRAFT_167884 [Auricularia subglabra TFB-10046 SS5]
MVVSAPSNPSPQLKPVLEWLYASEALDVDRLGAILSDEAFEDNVLPMSLGFPPCPSKAAWLDMFRGGISSWFDRHGFEFTFHEYFEGPGHITAHVSAEGETKYGQAMANEWLIVFQVRKDTSGAFKIVRILEFADSLSVAGIVRTEPTEDGQLGSAS